MKVKRKTTKLILILLLLSASVFSQYPEQEFQQRAQILIDYIADVHPAWNKGKRPMGFDGRVSDFGKYNYPKIIATFYKYGVNDTHSIIMNDRLNIYKTKETFHFNLVGLPRILYTYSNAPGIKGNDLEFIKRVFERKDSYNAWTCEGTENHVGMSRTSAYLYAQYALEKFPDSFPDATVKLAMIKEWMKYISKHVYQYGTTEWNSSIYNAYNVIGWINVYDFAKDAEVKNIAHAMLDYYSCELALNYSQAAICGSDMRGKGNSTSFKGSNAYLGWIWFGDSPLPLTTENLEQGEARNTEMIQSIHAALSSYRPPLAAWQIANKKTPLPAVYYNSKPSYLYEYPSYIKQVLYIDRNFTLGSAYLPFGGWSAGNFQIVPWRLTSRVNFGDTKTTQFLGGIGTYTPDKNFSCGNMRSPFDQIIQHKNILIQIAKVPENAQEIKDSIKAIHEKWKANWSRDFAKRFPTDIFKLNEQPVNFMEADVSKNQTSLILADNGIWESSTLGNILFIRYEKSFVLVRTIDNSVPGTWNTIDNKARFSTTSTIKGSICGYIIEVVNSDDYESFEAFQALAKQKTQVEAKNIGSDLIEYTSLKGEKIKVQYNESGSYTEPIFDWGYGSTEPMCIIKAPPFIQPTWPSGKGHGKLASYEVNNKKINTLKPWPVYSGPNLYIGNGLLMVKDAAGKTYSIDYKRDAPVFEKHLKWIDFKP